MAATEAQKAASRRYYWKHREKILPKLRALDRTDYLTRRYGITRDTYNQMFAAQDGKCAICSVTVKGKRLCVDHDHETGQVRGLLCDLCNTALGAVRDSTELLSKAIAYLKEHRHDE